MKKVVSVVMALAIAVGMMAVPAKRGGGGGGTSSGEHCAEIDIKSYYSNINGKSGSALRSALKTIISTGYTSVSYDNLAYLLKYADTENANGTDLIDIYTPCTFTISSNSISWSGSCSGKTNVGCGLNREHTVPQSWFGEQSPMVSDAFHIYAVDAASNGHRSNFFYGECTSGESYTGSNCNESGKLGTSNRAGYTGQVYEPADEYKGDIARGFFYMATRYADDCANWGNMFGNDNNGLTNYTVDLMLKWHREDPVSDKELIRNEVIYGNSTYNKSSYKQNNRNPFIDYPELVEHIWGNKSTTDVVLNDLVPACEGGSSSEGSYTDFLTDCAPVEQYTISLYDNLQFTTGYTPKEVQVNEGSTFTFPTISDVSVTDAQKTSGTCEQQHYHFVGWVSQSDKAHPTDANVKLGGSESEAVYDGASYYAVWAKEAE